MNAAQQMHDDLVSTLLPLIPQTVYRDLRRLNTLAWAITGLCLTHTVRLGAWAQALPSPAQSAASRERRFSRWLHNRAISPNAWYPPVIQAALRNWPAQTRLYVALDTTALTPFVLIRASLVYRGRAIPLAWRSLSHRSTQVSFEDYQPVLNQVRALVPPGLRVTLLADRGFVHEQLLHYLYKQQWHFRLRLMSKILVHLEDGTVSAVRDLCPPVGERRFLQQVSILGAGIGPVALALTCPLDQPTPPWFVASDEPTGAETLDEDGLRFDIEEGFLDEKSGGYQLHISELATPEALERLLLVVAIATVYWTSTGVSVVQAGKRRWVDAHWGRGLSYLKIGWRWHWQAYQRGWPILPPFRLDPAPDPLPVLASASRRDALRESCDGTLPMAG